MLNHAHSCAPLVNRKWSSPDMVTGFAHPGACRTNKAGALGQCSEAALMAGTAACSCLHSHLIQHHCCESAETEGRASAGAAVECAMEMERDRRRDRPRMER